MVFTYKTKGFHYLMSHIFSISNSQWFRNWYLLSKTSSRELNKGKLLCHILINGANTYCVPARYLPLLVTGDLWWAGLIWPLPSWSWCSRGRCRPQTINTHGLSGESCIGHGLRLGQRMSTKEACLTRTHWSWSLKCARSPAMWVARHGVCRAATEMQGKG